MSWGTGAWGGTPWGIGATAPIPTVISVSPGIVARRGGAVISLLGTGFSKPALIEVLSGLTVVGTCYAFEADDLNDGKTDGDLGLFALRSNRIFAGTPALADGVYDLRLTTPGGSSTLVGALTYQLFAEEAKAQKVRQKLASKWKVGRRLLTTGEALD